jgi:hypothetical protein
MRPKPRTRIIATRTVVRKEPFMIKPEFLVSKPLYSKCNLGHAYKVMTKVDDLFGPIQTACEVCKCERTFQLNSIDEYPGLRKPINRVSPGEAWDNLVFKPNYTCTACRGYSVNFMIRLHVNKSGQEFNVIARKEGQWPAPDIETDPDVKTRLGKHYDLFKKGRVCESQSYGIGAFGYYRRIIELIIRQLMDEVRDLLSDEDKSRFEQVLTEVESSHYAKDKIDLISTIVPESLKPGGHNPIGVLYRVLSEGLHSLTDEQCLELASDVRENLEVLVHLIDTTKRATKKLSDTMSKLMNKKGASE